MATRVRLDRELVRRGLAPSREAAGAAIRAGRVLVGGAVAAKPSTLVTTGDHDDRVVPAHSFKFAAALQAAQAGPAPVLIRIETKAGHGAGKPLKKQIEQYTDELSFLFGQLDMAGAVL